jgi:hypothetical protein
MQRSTPECTTMPDFWFFLPELVHHDPFRSDKRKNYMSPDIA